MVVNLNRNGKKLHRSCFSRMLMKEVVSVTFRYERELHPTRWSSIRQGAWFGIFVGWVSLISYIVYAVGFIFGSILMSYKDHTKINISDIIIVSNSYYRINQKHLIVYLSFILGCFHLCTNFNAIEFYRSFHPIIFRSPRCSSTSFSTH